MYGKPFGDSMTSKFSYYFAEAGANAVAGLTLRQNTYAIKLLQK